jgi:hypothetical protein
MSGLLSAGQIEDAADLDYIDEPVPEWKGAEGEPGIVRLLQLDAGTGLDLSAEMDDPKNTRIGMFLIIIYCAVDANNVRLWPTPPRTDPTYNDIIQSHIAKLKKKSMKVLNRLQRSCLKLNGMLREATNNSEVALKKD